MRYLFIIISVLSPFLIIAQSTFRCTIVVEDEKGNKLKGATVVIVKETPPKLTDKSGVSAFVLNRKEVYQESRLIQVKKSGYAKKRERINLTEKQIVIVLSPYRLPTLLVENNRDKEELENQRYKYETILSQKDDRIGQLLRESRRKSSTIEEKDKKIKQLYKQLTSTKAVNETLRKRVRDLENKNDALKKENKALQAKITVLEAKITDLTEENKQLKRDIQTLETLVQEQEEYITVLRTKVHNAKIISNKKAKTFTITFGLNVDGIPLDGDAVDIDCMVYAANRYNNKATTIPMTPKKIKPEYDYEKQVFYFDYSLVKAPKKVFVEIINKKVIGEIDEYKVIYKDIMYPKKGIN